MSVMRNHAKVLAERDVRVAVFGVADEALVDDLPGWEETHVSAFPSRQRSFAYAPALSTALMRFAPDIVHQHGLWQYPSLVTSRWRRLTGGPVVISPHGMLDPWALRNSAAKKRLATAFFERSNLSNAACIHCLGAEVNSVRAFGLVNPIAVTANGADLPQAGPKLPRPHWMDRRRTLLFLSRLHPKKGVAETLRAWSLLRRESADIAAGWQLAVAGHGPFEQATSRMIGEFGLDGSVHMPGPLFADAKRAALEHADAFILASHSEGLPMAVLDAWAHRLPVFMTRACNLPDGFAAGAAIEVSTDPVALAGTLAEHLRRADLPAIGCAGERLVRERYSWAHVVEQLHDVYRWLARNAPRPTCVETI